MIEIRTESGVVINGRDTIPSTAHGEVRFPLGPTVDVDVHDHGAHITGQRSRFTLAWDISSTVRVDEGSVFASRFAQATPIKVLCVVMAGSVITWTITLRE